MKYQYKDQKGSAHLIIIIVAVVVIIGAFGFAAWLAFGNGTSSVESAATKAAVDACAKETDKNICRFYASWKVGTKYRMTMTDSSGNTSIFEIDGKKTHMKTTGQMAYEVITIDKTTYTKAGDVWYSQTITDPSKDVTSSAKVDYKDPGTSDTTETAADKTTYKFITKETCGKLTCFKYEIVDPAMTDTKQFIWFDDTDYKMQKSRTEGPDGVSEQAFEYTGVSVNVPSPVKKLATDQYLVPGQTEPTTIPSTTDL